MYGKTFFQNHSSIVHKYYDKGQVKYVMTDPWFDKPAFGSWLPSIPPAIGKERILALAYEERLSIVISHAHDDHCDDDFLELLPKNILLIIPKFRGPGLKRRLSKLGFENIQEVSSEPLKLEGVIFRSFINENMSLDDAIVTLETSTETLIHNNDNWFLYCEETQKAIKEMVGERNDTKRILFMSQTNSASGFPFAYKDLRPDEKERINLTKVKSMVETGIKNCREVGAIKFLSYAGYASVYVKGKPEYIESSINPTSHWIEENCETHDVEVLDMLPGDYYDHETGNVIDHFMKDSLQSAYYQQSRDEVYFSTKLVEKCDTFSPYEGEYEHFEDKLEYFLIHLNEFVTSRIESVSFFSTLTSKSFSIKVNSINISKTLVFGEGLKENVRDSDKILTVSSDVMYKVLEGDILFENTYTGYEGLWSRKSEYNRDIIMAIVMFSYFYKNNVVKRRSPF